MQGESLRAFVLAAAVLVACDSSEPEVIESSPQIFCGALCDAESRCGEQAPPESCRQDCIANRPGLVHLSPEAAPIYSDCIGQLTCEELYTDEAFSACWDDTRTRIEATPQTRAFCQNYTLAIFECGYSLSTEECEETYGMWATPVLDRVTSCTEILDCVAFDACVAGVFDSL
jgi:hypothetical protein